MRTRVFTGIFMVTLTFLGMYLFKLQVIDHASLSDQARRNFIKPLVIPHSRGKILDRNGVVLADWVPQFRVSVIPEKVDSGYLLELEKVFGPGPDLDSLKLTSGYATFAEGVEFETIVYLEERSEQYPWLTISVIPTRFYPYGRLFSHVLGYIGRVTEEDIREKPDYRSDHWIGRMGAEKEFERLLRGEDGYRFFAVNAVGRIVQEDPRPMIPPTAGQNLRVTLDASLQLYVDSLFQRYQRGACIVMDPRTGDILVMYSKPAFDPNILASGPSADEWNSLLTSASSPLLNRACSGLYPPGSIFKLITVMMGIDMGFVDRRTRLGVCHGTYWFGDRSWRCWKFEGHGNVDLLEAIEVSCDIYFYQLAREIGLSEFLLDLVGREIPPVYDFDFPELRRGFTPTLEWYDRQYGSRGYGPGNVLNLGIGQGELLMTPLEITLTTAAIAWNGAAESPSILTRTKLASKEMRAKKVVLNYSPKALGLAKEGMKRAVEGREATGYAARVRGIEVAGKTGTVQNPKGEDHSLFTCFAPYESPEIVVTIVVENAGSGSAFAAPMAGRILERYFYGEPAVTSGSDDRFGH
jgi:penicillin-binding protein 2